VTYASNLLDQIEELTRDRDSLRGYVEEIKKLASDPFASEAVALRACLLAAYEALGLPGPESSPLRDTARAVIAEMQAAAPDFGPMEVVVNDQRYVREATLFAAMRRADDLGAALVSIAEKADWYAKNDQRDPQEVDHALCVEVLTLAQEAI
jgi:hypothetical protein